jgi:molecular chaperone GrpE
MADETKANEGCVEAAEVGPGPDVSSQSSQYWETELAAAREEARASHDRWLRERADLENLKKRAARERTDAIQFGVEGLARDLLPMIDNLERALQHLSASGEHASMIEGVELTLRGVRDALQRHGVTRITAHGQLFDPTLHEAVGHQESAEFAPNTVMQEHQAGYLLHDRLLRPALVTVAKAAA